MDVAYDGWGVTDITGVCITDDVDVGFTDVVDVGVTDVVDVGVTDVVIYVISSHMSYLYVMYGTLSMYFAVNNLQNVPIGVFHIS